MPNDLQGLVGFIIGLVGEVLDEAGAMLARLGVTFFGYSIDPAVIGAVNTGIFGENGGWLYWINDENLWMMNEVLKAIDWIR